MADRRPGRPRDETVDARVLRATQDVLIEVGFDRLTIEAVAERCGVGRATIYRRWKDKVALVVDAASELYSSPSAPDTGGLRSDLLECGRAFVQGGERSQRVLAALLAALSSNPSLRESATEPLATPYIDVFRVVLLRAEAQGRLRSGVDIELLSSTFSALAFERLVGYALTVDDAFVVRVVDGLLLPACVGQPN